jgi:hypothetical protein
VSQVCAVVQSEETGNTFPLDEKRTWSQVACRESGAVEKAPGNSPGVRGKINPSLAITALSVEFVAVPHEAKNVQAVIPADIDEALQVVDGYAGCMVLASDQEARLITVITLWSGAERVRRCNENEKWVKRLLTPYVDHWLRTQTLVTSLKGMQQFLVGAGY